MDTQDEPLRADFSGLMQLQYALNDLDKIAHALRVWPEASRRSDPTPPSTLTPDHGKRLELLDALAELLRQEGRAGLELSLSRLLTEHSAVSRRSEAERSVEPPPASNGERFHVLRPHAEGGLGTVSIALDHELKREVALKQIHARQADDPSRRDRFILEAEITGGLE